MSDMNDGAAASGESTVAPTPAPERDEAVAPPNPVSTEREPKQDAAPEKKEPVKEPVSTRDALKRAAEKVDAKEKSDAKAKDGKEEPSRAPKEVKTEGQPRGEHGHFAGKDQNKDGGDKQPDANAKPEDGQAQQPAKPQAQSQQQSDAPARWLPEAKREWANTHQVVRDEVTRTVAELEGGLQKYKESHDEFEKLKVYHDAAKKGGFDLKQVMDKYTYLDLLIQRDPIKAMQEICDARNFSFRKIAEAYLDREPNQVADQQDQTVRELRAEIAELKRGFGGINQNLQQQHERAINDRVNEFAAKNPRFHELSDEIAQEIGHGYSLEEAYDRASRLKPAPSPEPAPRAQAKPEVPTAAQTGKGEKSISGPPSAGSNPVTKRSSPSIREALLSAAERAG